MLSNSGLLTAEQIICVTSVAMVSVVGAGMETHPGTAATMFEALYDSNINIQMISTSEIKITVLINRDDVDVAMKAVHDKFKMASVNMRKFGADED
jgi:aspartate kinase